MIKVFLRQEIWRNSVDLVIFEERNGKRYLAKPLVFEEYDWDSIAEPTASFRADDNVPQQLKNELNIMGLINNADAATVQAKDAHLEDMRTLVFRKDHPNGQ